MKLKTLLAAVLALMLVFASAAAVQAGDSFAGDALAVAAAGNGSKLGHQNGHGEEELDMVEDIVEETGTVESEEGEIDGDSDSNDDISDGVNGNAAGSNAGGTQKNRHRFEVKVEKGKIEISDGENEFELKGGKIKLKLQAGLENENESELEKYGNKFTGEFKEKKEGAAGRGVKLLRLKLKAYEAAQEQGVDLEEFVGDFKDIGNHWAKNAVMRMKAIGVVAGYEEEDGSFTFRPDSPITQAEAIALAARLFNNEVGNGDEEGSGGDVVQDGNGDETGGESGGEVQGGTENEVPDEELADVPEWARNEVRVMARNRILNLNRFHSQVQASRVQSCAWIAQAIGLEPVDASQLPFKDGVLISPEDAGYIMALYQEGIIKGTPEGNFKPNSSITRAEIAAIIDRILSQQEDAGETAEEGTAGETGSEGTENSGETTGENLQ